MASRRGTHLVLAAVVIAFVAALVAAAAFLTGSDGQAQAPPPRPAAAANPALVPLPESAAVPTTNGMTAALAAAVADPNLGNLTGRITDAQTGQQIWEQRADMPMQPASTNKLLTTAAALLTLDRNARVATTVRAADQTRMPGTVVLVGGGDPTLSAAPPGVQTWYHGAARISDLADQVRKSGVTATAVQVDTSLFTGPDMAPGWDPEDIGGGDIAPIQSVMLDAGRIQPTTIESRRSVTPALDAGRALAVALGVDPARVTFAPGPADGRQLASVQSAPLMGRPLSFAGGVDAVLSKLAAEKVDVTGASLVDSSGLSVADLLTAKNLDEVVNAAAGPDHPGLRPLVDLLPVAGGSGTLSNRFFDADVAKSPTGWLRAKTGSLTKTNALAGIVTDTGGRVLTFAFISNNAGISGRTAIDALAGVLRTCGCG